MSKKPKKKSKVKKYHPKGQMTIIGLILLFISLVVLAALTPTIVERIDYAKNWTDSTTDVILDIIPFLFFIAIIIGIVVYAAPQRRQE